MITSKNNTILIYSNNNFKEPKCTLQIKCFPKQILLQNENKFILLSDDSKIILIQTDSKIRTEIIFEDKDKEDNISSIINVNNCEIAIIFKNRIVIFYNIEKKEETKKLQINSNTVISLLDNSCIFNGYLYITSLDSIFKFILIKKK